MHADVYSDDVDADVHFAVNERCECQRTERCGQIDPFHERSPRHASSQDALVPQACTDFSYCVIKLRNSRYYMMYWKQSHDFDSPASEVQSKVGYVIFFFF